MLRPTDQTGVKTSIGMINYYGEFISHLSPLLNAFYKLLRKDAKFDWLIACKTAFIAAKNANAAG